MLSEFVALSKSVGLLGTLLRNAKDINNYNEVSSAIAKVHEGLLAAQTTAIESQEKISNLLSENAKLKNELAKAEGWDQKAKQYELVTTAGGAVVDRYIGKPEHFSCPSCFEKHETQKLQDRRSRSGLFYCPGCAVDFPVKPEEKTRPPTRRDRF